MNADSESDHVLRVEGLTVDYGGVRAVDDLSLVLGGGLLYGLIGPNGSGKSTVVSAISRLNVPSRGRFWLQGQEFTRASSAEAARRGIARTFQTLRLLPRLSVLENVMLGGDYRLHDTSLLRRWCLPLHSRRQEGALQAAAIAALERLGIGALGSTMVGGLPYGAQRRVEIARSLMGEPSLVLLDEPTAGMIHSERTEMCTLLRALCADGLTILLVEHDVRMMVNVTDYLFAMNFGHIVAQGAPRDVIRDRTVQTAYLGHGFADA
jgi:branched-chain amino acid transport system ATP-binding protein